MKNIVMFCLVGLLTLTTTGCIYVNGKQVEFDDWQDKQRANREEIAALVIGTSRDEVVRQLGTPNDSEAFELDGDDVRILFYRTHRKHSDGETSRDETTPLVFRNDRLVGWGSAVYENLRN